jgi:hypothetical protein
MKAVRRENGKTFIHVVDDQDPQPVASSTKTKVSAATNQRVAKRVFVNVTADDSVAGDTLMLRIEPVTIDQLKDGDQVVVGGTHYLDDGARVRVVPGQRASEGGR